MKLSIASTILLCNLAIAKSFQYQDFFSPHEEEYDPLKFDPK